VLSQTGVLLHTQDVGQKKDEYRQATFNEIFSRLEMPKVAPDSSPLDQLKHPDKKAPLERVYDVEPEASIIYASRSEYACAKMLEAHVPGWKARLDDTIQIQFSHGRAVDFRVENLLVEWHPISMHREFLDRDALRTVLRVAKKLPPYWQQELKESLESELMSQYARRRLHMIRDHPTWNTCEFYAVATPERFYRKILKRFADKPLKEADFHAEFKWHCSHAKANDLVPVKRRKNNG
jgi:hypothetical protein